MIKVSASLLAANWLQRGRGHRPRARGGRGLAALRRDGRHVLCPIYRSGRDCSARSKISILIATCTFMIKQPERYIEEFAAAGADGITVHVESTHHLHRVLQQIRALGKRPGVVLNPATPLTELEYVLDDVENGADNERKSRLRRPEADRKLLPRCGRSARHVRAARADDMLIEVDGGSTAQTAPKLIEAGANAGCGFCAASAQSDPAAVVKALRQEN